jgi:hypothetical protein
MQCVAQDAVEVAELQKEVTRAQVAAVMVRARTAQAEGMAREKTTLLVTTLGEAVEVTQRVSVLGDELVAMRWAQDVAEEEVLSLVAKVATTDQR